MLARSQHSRSVLRLAGVRAELRPQHFQACVRDVVALDLDLRVTSFDRFMPYRLQTRTRPTSIGVAGALSAGTANNTRVGEAHAGGDLQFRGSSAGEPTQQCDACNSEHASKGRNLAVYLTVRRLSADNLPVLRSVPTSKETFIEALHPLPFDCAECFRCTATLAGFPDFDPYGAKPDRYVPWTFLDRMLSAPTRTPQPRPSRWANFS